MTLVEINPHSMMSYEWTGVLGQGPPALLLACLGLNLAMIQIRSRHNSLSKVSQWPVWHPGEMGRQAVDTGVSLTIPFPERLERHRTSRTLLPLRSGGGSVCLAISTAPGAVLGSVSEPLMDISVTSVDKELR